MDAFWKKKIFACLIFIVGSIFCELLTFELAGIPFPKYFIIDFSVMLVIAGIILMIPSHVAGAVLYSAVFVFQCAVSGAHVELYRIFGDVFTMDYLSLVTEAGAAVGDEGGLAVINWWNIFAFVILIASMIAAQVFWLIKYKAPKFPIRKQLVLAFTFVFSFFSFGITLAASAQAAGLPNDDKGITGISVRQNFDKLYYKVNFFKSFGTYSLFFKNTILGIKHGNILERRSIEETKRFFNGATKMPRHDYETSTEVLNGKGGIGPDVGNNVIVVMMESFDNIFLHEELTPTVYNLMQDSINFTNYHSQHKTDVSETMVMLGGYPGNENLVASWNEGGDSDRDTRNSRMATSFPFSLPNVLKDAGVATANYFHPATGVTYARKYSHTGYGFDNAYFNESFPKETFGEHEKYLGTWAMPDKVFYELAIEKIMPKERFFSFITTVSGHWPYTRQPTDNAGKANLARVKEFDAAGEFDHFNMSDSTKELYMNALARMMTTDQGVQYLLDELETREDANGHKLLESTTLLFYADHNAYGNDLRYKVMGEDKYTPSAFNVPAFIWSPNIKGFEHDKFMTPVDLVPTLFDLLDIDVNPRMYLGLNAFESQSYVSYSRLGVVFNDLIVTDGMDIKFSANSVTEVEERGFSNSYEYLMQRWSYVNRLYYPENTNYAQFLYDWPNARNYR